MAIADNNTLSIIVLTYNQSAYIYRLLDSVFSQTYPSIELVITDDGSKDFDAVRLNLYINANKKDNIVAVKIIHEDVNVGTTKNINRGITNSSGSFIKIIAGDDFYPTDDIFQKQVSFLTENQEYLIVTGKSADCSENEDDIHTKGVEDTNKLMAKVFEMPLKHRLHYCSRHRIFPYMTQSMCFRRSFFDKYGLYNEDCVLIEDTTMAMRIVENDIKIGLIDACVIMHRLGTGVSTSKNLFKASGIRYYIDIKYLSWISYKKEKNPWRKIAQHNRYKIACFRLEMAQKKENESKTQIIIRYLPSLLFYSILNIDVFIDKFCSFRKSI